MTHLAGPEILAFMLVASPHVKVWLDIFTSSMISSGCSIWFVNLDGLLIENLLNEPQRTQREHLNESRPPLEIRVRSQESGARRKESEGRRKKEGARRSVFTNMRCSRTQRPKRGEKEQSRNLLI
ncbi:hypothetical protein [Microcoleus sp. B5-D4]|uniref:hypothetical protein n=1 Tax=Microcoleus sp. B5-D4 TaxID=2818681 RepID=UPI002FCEED4A